MSTNTSLHEEARVLPELAKGVSFPDEDGTFADVTLSQSPCAQRSLDVENLPLGSSTEGLQYGELDVDDLMDASEL